MSSNDPISQETPDATFYVSGVDISLAMDSNKTIGSIKLSTKNNESLRNVQRIICAGGVHREEFSPPLPLDPDDHISVSVGCSSKWQKQVEVPIDINIRDVGCMRDEQGVESYRKRARKVEVVVTGYHQHEKVCTPIVLWAEWQDSAQRQGRTGTARQTSKFRDASATYSHEESFATATQLIEVCSQFRLLIIGNSGVGKSSLIRKVFGVKDVDTSETTRGEANIERELTSSTNNRFVVHDSLGFEAGDEENMEIVKQFVARRKAMPQLKDQLHAVWLCLEIPYAGGRLLEGGVEQFLQRRNEILGEIPLVVVLTKVDLLDVQLEMDLPSNEIVHYKPKYLREQCIKHLHEAAGSDVTHVTVSTRDPYLDSLLNLLKATNDNMAKYHVDEAPRAMASIAQRISIKEKIELSIAIGKKKYWKMLLKSAIFRGHTLKECLEVIHKDIITVWNFNDPDLCLLDDEIINALLRTDNLGAVTDPSLNGASFTGLLTSGVELFTGLSGSGDVTLSVLVPIARIAITVAQMAHGMYQEAQKDVKILMAYIVDLICVMQAIFLLTSSGRVTSETVTLTLQAYETPRKIVHVMVDEFDGKAEGRDHVLEKIEALIWRHSIPDHEIQELRQRIGRVLVPSGSGS